MASKGSRSKKGTQRKLAAILCADVTGYSRLMGADEEATIATLTAYRKVFLSHIEFHHGRVVDAKGDAILAEFGSVVDAVNGAVAIQQELAGKNAALPDERRMDFRIGINLGDVVVQDEVIYGDGVNIAARLESLAEPGGLCISGSAYDQVKTKLKVGFDSLGEQQVKNISEPVRAYRVILPSPAGDGPGGEPEADRAGYAGPGPASLEISGPASIAVLPFANMSGDPEQEYFCDGISDDLITDLSRVSSLSVIACNSSFQYRGQNVDVRRVGEELGVAFVLEGGVRKAANRVRVTAQLIETKFGRHIWAERFDRELSEIFALQDELSERIGGAINVHLVEGEKYNIYSSHLETHAARGLYRKGTEICWNQLTRETNGKARALFQQVIDTEPGAPNGYHGVAWTHWFDARFRWVSAPEESLDRAGELADKVLGMADSFHGAMTLRGCCSLLRRNHEDAVTWCSRAVEQFPDHSLVAAHYAEVLNFSGEPRRAARTIRKAMGLMPIYPGWFLGVLGVAHRLDGDLPHAEQALRSALARDPLSHEARLNLIAVLLAEGREQEGRAAATEFLNMNPGFSLGEFSATQPFKDPGVLDKLIDELRKAGLPE